MTAKQVIRSVLEHQPDNATARQIVEAIQIRLELEEGIRQIEAGEYHTLTESEAEFGL